MFPGLCREQHSTICVEALAACPQTPSPLPGMLGTSSGLPVSPGGFCCGCDCNHAGCEFDFAVFVLTACSNSKAVGAPPPLTALPCCLIRTVFLVGIVRVSKLDREGSAAALHLRPRSPTQAGTTPVRPKKNSASPVTLKRKCDGMQRAR